MNEFKTDHPVITNHNVIVVCENGDRHHFKQSMIEDANMMTSLIRDIAKFFVLGKVKGRYIHMAYPLEENTDKPGQFAKTAREVGQQIIKMHQLANAEDRAGIAESLPILNYIEQFAYNDAKETMVALQIMGHHEDAIFFMFMHLKSSEVWP